MAKKLNFKLSKEDSELFRREVGNVRPLRHDKITLRHAPSHERGKPVKPVSHRPWLEQQQALRDELSDDIDVGTLETSDDMLFVRSGMQHGLLRKLRRGQFNISGQLDLHGLTVPEARQALAGFLHASQTRGARCVTIIHGKGYGSHHKQPILKNKVNSWLQQHDEVLAFCSAQPADGGTGAVYVLLRRGNTSD